MRIKHHEIEIPTNSPFANCKLNRESYAKVLTEIVENYADGFVLAINNEWGTGKTTFVKMWKQQLDNEGFQTVYFSAWENDFHSNPLVALMSELKPLTKGKVDGEKVFKSVIEKGAVLATSIVPVLTKSLIDKYIVKTDEISEAIQNVTKAAAEILEEEIKEYSDKKKTIIEFRQELQKFIKKSKDGKPLIFIIDELDRCRPNYAVELLEQLKHFFSVSGIIFVLSIDKRHLASSIRGYYGSEHINTDEYLRRFIDLEYSIPRPSNKLFCQYLFDYYALGEFFHSPERAHPDLKGDPENLLRVSELLFNKTNATLRQQEKIFAMMGLIINSFKKNEYTFSHLLLALIYIKVMKGELYQKIEHDSLTIQELSDDFIEIIPIEIKNEYGLNLTFTVALLLHFYNNSKGRQNKIQLLEFASAGDKTTPIKMRGNGEDNQELAGLFEHIGRQNYRDMSLKHFISKINLSDSIVLSRGD